MKGMTRQFRSDRLYLLTRNIILIISLVSLLYAIYVHLRLPEINRIYVEEIGKCSEMFFNNNPEKNCAMWHKYLNDSNAAVFYGYLVGLGLPFILFGSRAIFNFIAPEIRKNK